MKEPITAKFPAIFANDHSERELPTGKLIGKNSRYHTFLIEDGSGCRMLTAKEVLKEWESDALYYVEMDKAGGFDHEGDDFLKPLCRSAARTLRIARDLLREHFPSGETK
jgi:hypothetical protein